jgi:hypothetical protein
MKQVLSAHDVVRMKAQTTPHSNVTLLHKQALNWTPNSSCRWLAQACLNTLQLAHYERMDISLSSGIHVILTATEILNFGQVLTYSGPQCSGTRLYAVCIQCPYCCPGGLSLFSYCVGRVYSYGSPHGVHRERSSPSIGSNSSCSVCPLNHAINAHSYYTEDGQWAN